MVGQVPFSIGRGKKLVVLGLLVLGLMLAGIPKNSTKSLTISLGPKKIIPCPWVTLTWRLPKALQNTLWRKLTKSETSLSVYHHTPPS